MRRIFLCSATSTDALKLTTIPYWFALANLHSLAGQQSCRALLLGHFPMDWLKRQAAVEPSLLEPAQRRRAPREKDSESSPHSPERAFQPGWLGSVVVLTRQQGQRPNCSESSALRQSL